METKKKTPILPIVLGAVLLVCCCLIVLLGGVYYAAKRFNASVLPTVIASSTLVPDLPGRPTSTPPELDRPAIEEISTATLALLEQTIVPINDTPDIACRLKGICDVPATFDPPAVPLLIGDRDTFWASNNDTNESFQAEATLRYITEHAYFWVADGVSYDEYEMSALMDTFENQIYPTNREFFGSEWTPGVDGDPHIYILYVDNLGFSIAGYYSPSDEYNPLVQQYSNAHEMFYLAASQDLGDAYTYSVLTHEFQHMIHWNQDGNETSFIDEGMAELAVHLNGYETGNFDWYYTSNPDIPLTDWQGGSGDNTAHYGANFLFATYFLDRFGEEITQALVHEQANSLQSVDAVLAAHDARDPLTGEPIDADDFFLDWVIANFVHDEAAADGRYFYHNYPGAPIPGPTESIDACPTVVSTRNLSQYGVDYIRITCPGRYTFAFSGTTRAAVLPADPHSGDFYVWSNKGDKSDMRLTRSFDLSGVSGPVEMTYWTWYDIEEDWDYAYVEASTDGIHWDILTTPSGTGSNPLGNSFGWGYTGLSNGWIQETVDLSAYAGGQVSIRFEYITDAAVNGEGLIVDDIEIPAIAYAEDFESGDGGWQGEGFVRIENVLPQTFRLALITRGAGGTEVQIIPVNPDQTAEASIDIGGDVNEAILAVTATTRFTRIPAAYQFEIR